MLRVTLFCVSELPFEPTISPKVLPPSVLIYHWGVGVGEPLAAAVNVADWPTATVWLVGWVVMVGATGAGVTIRTAAVVVALPVPLVKTASYW